MTSFSSSGVYLSEFNMFFGIILQAVNASEPSAICRRFRDGYLDTSDSNLDAYRFFCHLTSYETQLNNNTCLSPINVKTERNRDKSDQSEGKTEYALYWCIPLYHFLARFLHWFCWSTCVRVQISLPYVTMGGIRLLYIAFLVLREFVFQGTYACKVCSIFTPYPFLSGVDNSSFVV